MEPRRVIVSFLAGGNRCRYNVVNMKQWCTVIGVTNQDSTARADAQRHIVTDE